MSDTPSDNDFADDFAKGIAEFGEKLCKSQVPLDPEIRAVLTNDALWNLMANTETKSCTPRSDLLEQSRKDLREPTSPSYLSALRLCRRLEQELEALRPQSKAEEPTSLSSRAWTKEEVRDQFLVEVRMRAKHWASSQHKDYTIEERCQGVAFSILSLMDGCTDFPAVDLVLSPHPDDKAYLQEGGENWYEPGMVINDDVHLHDLFYEKENHGTGSGY